MLLRLLFSLGFLTAVFGPAACKEQAEKIEKKDLLEVDADCEFSPHFLDEKNQREMHSHLQNTSEAIEFEQFRNNYLLVFYSRYGQIDKVKSLITGGANVNYHYKFGDGFPPALAWAARCGRAEIAEILLKKRANPNLKFTYVYPGSVRHENVTPTFWAQQWKPDETLKILVRQGGDVSIKEKVTNLRGQDNG